VTRPEAEGEATTTAPEATEEEDDLVATSAIKIKSTSSIYILCPLYFFSISIEV
jgi:hypothetical protein